MRLVLLPGLDGTGDLFEPLIEKLPRGIEPQVVSYPSDGSQSYADLLERVRTALPTNEPYVLLGWSFSGPLALMVAADAPQNLRGVILCSSFASNPQPLLGWLAPLASAPLCGLFPYGTQINALLGGYSNADLRRRIAAANAKVGAAALAQRLRAVLKLKPGNLASHCPVPILYIAGTRDPVVPLRNAKVILSTARHARLVTIPGPHVVLLTNSATAARAISEFCDSLR